MTEGEIQKQIIDYLKLQNAIVVRHNSGRARNNIKLSPVGFPDLQAILADGRIVFIEVKTPTGELRASQQIMIDILKKRGQTVIVARSLDDLRKEI